MMDSVISWILENALATAVLAGLVALVCRITRCRPAIEHALWVVVLLKLLMPPVVQWPEEWRKRVPPPLGLFSSTRETPEDAMSRPPGAARLVVAPIETPAEDALAVEGVAMEAELALADEVFDVAPLVAAGSLDGAGPEVARVDPTADLPLARAVVANEQPETRTPVAAVPSGIAATSPSLATLARTWLPRVWLGGLLLLLLFHVAWILRFVRALGHARPASLEIRSEVETLASRLGMRAPRTRILPGAGSPLAWGLGRPTLLLPASLVDRLPLEAWRGILLHELAHLRRRDHYVGCLLVAAQCIWWWNPVFWYVRRRLGESAELACDAWVVWAEPGDRRRYAESLLEVARTMARGPGRRSPLPLTTFLKARAGHAARREFERRLTMILTATHGRSVPGLGLLALALIALLAAPAWSAGQDSTDNGASTDDAASTEGSIGIADLSDPLAVNAPAVDLNIGLGGNVEEVGAVASEDRLVAPKVEVVDGIIVAPAVRVSRSEIPEIPAEALDVALEVAVGEDAMSSSKDQRDRRIERIEKNVEKLERHLEAVLAELRSLRQAGSGSGDYSSTFAPRSTSSRPAVADPAPTPVRVPTSSSGRVATTRRPSSSGRYGAHSEDAYGANTATAGTTRSGVRSYSSGRSRAATSQRTTSRRNRSSGMSSPVTRLSSVDRAADFDATRYETTAVRTLIQATYDLPEGKAKALADFLREHVSAELRIVATDEQITVTAPSDTQEMVEGLIRLLTPKRARNEPRAKSAGSSVLR